MPSNMLDYDKGYDAYDMGDPFDATKSQDWQNGYFDAQADEFADDV